jgi:hypothetical protein
MARSRVGGSAGREHLGFEQGQQDQRVQVPAQGLAGQHAGGRLLKAAADRDCLRRQLGREVGQDRGDRIGVGEAGILQADRVNQQGRGGRGLGDAMVLGPRAGRLLRRRQAAAEPGDERRQAGLDRRRAGHLVPGSGQQKWDRRQQQQIEHEQDQQRPGQPAVPVPGAPPPADGRRPMGSKSVASHNASPQVSRPFSIAHGGQNNRVADDGRVKKTLIARQISNASAARQIRRCALRYITIAGGWAIVDQRF